MNHYSRLTRSCRFAASVCLTLVVVSTAACDGDDATGQSSGTGSTPPQSPGTGNPPPTSTGDGIDEATLASCPQTTTLIETAEWPSCLAGKRVTGTEPFSKEPCELRIGANGVFEYLRGGAVAIAVPARSQWRSGTGNYQNTAGSGPRIFLAGIAPDLEVVDGQPRVTNVNLSFFAFAGQQDNVEIKYLDAARNRQTYNCSVNVL